MAKKTSAAALRVNNVQIDWTNDSRRKERPCRGCKLPTTGRRDEVGGRSSAWCLPCAMADAFRRGGL
ncbi:MAG TPA: hypothetical protein VLI45_09330 [Acidobacteriaceae bacterium]|nr:hypothetical protein [Acidobacteriaceae bacterium]